MLKNYQFDGNSSLWEKYIHMMKTCWYYKSLQKIHCCDENVLLKWKLIHLLCWWISKTLVKICCDESLQLGWKLIPVIKLIDVMKVYLCD